MKKLIISLIMAMFLISTVSALNFGKIRTASYNSDEILEHVNVRNDVTKDLENVKITIYMPMLGIYQKSGGFDIDGGEIQGKFVFVDIPKSAPRGDYLARISISNDDYRDVSYTWISII